MCKKLKEPVGIDMTTHFYSHGSKTKFGNHETDPNGKFRTFHWNSAELKMFLLMIRVSYLSLKEQLEDTKRVTRSCKSIHRQYNYHKKKDKMKMILMKKIIHRNLNTGRIKSSWSISGTRCVTISYPLNDI
jgi:hypothetical protein